MIITMPAGLQLSISISACTPSSSVTSCSINCFGSSCPLCKKRQYILSQENPEKLNHVNQRSLILSPCYPVPWVYWVLLNTSNFGKPACTMRPPPFLYMYGSSQLTQVAFEPCRVDCKICTLYSDVRFC